MSDNGFHDRLQSAARRAGIKPAPSTPAAQDMNALPPTAWGIGARMGVEVVSAFIAGAGLGYFLDRWLHTLPLFLILGVIFGGVAGVWNVWRLMR